MFTRIGASIVAGSDGNVLVSIRGQSLRTAAFTTYVLCTEYTYAELAWRLSPDCIKMSTRRV